jgi:small subunit ribosomal protein S8
MGVVTDPIADMLTRLRNAQAARLPFADIPNSKLKLNIAKILKAEGYVADYTVQGEGISSVIRVEFNGAKGKFKPLNGLRRVSKPGLRTYAPTGSLPKVLGGYGIAIISTSKGLLTDRQARKANVGGEVLCYIW